MLDWGAVEFNLADLIEAAADAVPEREAIVAGGRRLRFRELEERSNRLAHALGAAGIGPGDAVGIHARNRVEWVESMLALFKLRAVPININYRYVAAELRYLFENADLVGLILEREFAPRLREVRGALPKLRELFVLEDGSAADLGGLDAPPYEAALQGGSPERDFAPRSADDHYVLYTGGTTGMPKGVIWRHEDLIFGALGGALADPPLEGPGSFSERGAAQAPLTAIAIAPLMHGQAQWLTLSSLITGGRVVLYTEPSFDPHAIWHLVERERVQSLIITGDAMGRPLAEALAEAGVRYDTSSLLLLNSGAAILSPSVKDELRARLPHVSVLDSFGASETGYNGTVMDLGGAAAGPRFRMNEFTAVLDDDLEPLAPGSETIGRLARRGHIPLGYHGDPEKTAATFPTDRHGVRWVIPGDYARVEADGTILLLGRGAVCINSGGEKIFPEEVEAVLKSHPDVFDAIVLGVPDPRWGERVAAVVQPRPNREPTLEALAAHVRTRLAGYKVPRELRLVGELRRTPAGKPDYRWAREQYGV
ncbi:MAG: acyl-CoA synthetase [Myxococcota bacterium]